MPKWSKGEVSKDRGTDGLCSGGLEDIDEVKVCTDGPEHDCSE